MTGTKRTRGPAGALGKRVYESLKNDVLKGAFPPGFPLVERDIADRLGASRTPIRAALQRLETEGLLERRGHSGFRVRLPDIQSALEVLDVREAIEGMAARLAARNADDGGRQQFNSIISDMEHCERTSDAINYYRLCGELHRAIFAASHNATLYDLVLKISAQSTVLHYKTLLVEERIEKSIEEHRAIVDAIIKGDEDEAELRIRRHIRQIKHLVANLNKMNSAPTAAL